MSHFDGPDFELDWPGPVRTGPGENDVNGHHRPDDAVEPVRWLGWWIDPVDLVAWHPEDWAYGVHLRDLVDVRRALFTLVHIAQRYHHPGPIAPTPRHRLAVGFAVLLDDVVGVRDGIAVSPYRVPTADEVRGRLADIAARVAAGTD